MWTSFVDLGSANVGGRAGAFVDLDVEGQAVAGKGGKGGRGAVLARAGAEPSVFHARGLSAFAGAASSRASQPGAPALERTATPERGSFGRSERLRVKAGSPAAPGHAAGGLEAPADWWSERGERPCWARSVSTAAFGRVV